jgi:hypothetical protein
MWLAWGAFLMSSRRLRFGEVSPEGNMREEASCSQIVVLFAFSAVMLYESR